ncbi:hypothetical protein AXF42_Ash020055 [Apostasia shenzhenica]|uniref:Uncharacterized protein n=1 Tax=Apostasia shenzhenica TaxID=1088818 RepID=A0A2I0B4Q4_9ASPA|nr:hypothetical protein AXF42_Ash020055 [Apostasia shenzhenica]
MGFTKPNPGMKRGSKKSCRNFLWRLREVIRKAVRMERKEQVRFNYDPWSYALNFDDSCGDSRGTDAVESFWAEEMRAGRSYRRVYAVNIGQYY